MSAKRMVDRNGMRGGAGISAAVLLVAFVLDARAIVPIVATALGVGSIAGLRYSPLGWTYRALKKIFRLGIPVELEEEPPPRFAQTLGFAVLGLASVAFWVFESSVAGWMLALLVAGLQALLAGTGLCIGCEIYLYGRRFVAKEA